MKKFIFFLYCFTSVRVLAADDAIALAKRNALELARESRVELVQIQDKLLEQLLKIPFEKRAYIYPALFEEETVPKKVLTHPQIIIWKGKKPTRIAPQLQEYAKKYLNTMSAKFYPILDPDVWPSAEKEGEWKDLQQMAPTIWNTTDSLMDETAVQ